MSLLDKVSRSHVPISFARAPFVFSYDISDPRDARAVRRCLRQWRIDGQLSVHEAVMTPLEVETISVELMELVNPETDRLLVFRLSRRGRGPIIKLSALLPEPPFVRTSSSFPKSLHNGWYVLAYDIREAQRLRRLQRVMSRHTAFLQRSVYLFCGTGERLLTLVRETLELVRFGEDDVRIYVLSDPDELWFLCGGMPPLGGLAHRQQPLVDLSAVTEITDANDSMYLIWNT